MSELHPGHDGSMDLGFGPDPQPADRANVNTTTGGHITLTQDQFEALLNRFSPQSSVEDDYAAALSGVGPEPITTPELDFSQLPDPARDPEGFRQGLGAVLNQGAQQVYQAAALNTQRINTEQQAYSQAWDLMRERYPELARYPTQIQAAATREWDDLRARGIEPVNVLLHNMDAAVEAVANRAQTEINHIRGLQEGEGGDDGYRTDMLDGRGPGPSAPKPGAKSTQQTSFVDDLKKLQRELGIY